MDQFPSVGRVVHYVSYGTPGGEYTSQCRAAVITEVSTRMPIGEDQAVFAPNDRLRVGLCVLNPSGQFFNADVPRHDGEENPDGHSTELCHGLEFDGGSWHWPEIVR